MVSSVGYDNYLEDQYHVPFLAKVLHSLPHLNISLHRTNNTFRPTDEIYLESLGLLGSIPAAALIFSLFCLLLYLMSRCCDRKPRPAHSITSLKVTLSIVTVLCCAAIGLGLYGNDDLHNGLLELLTAGRKVDNLVSSVRNQTNALEHTLTQKIRPQLTELADIFDEPVSNQTAASMLITSLDMVQKNITIATNAAGDIRRPLMGISLNHVLNKGDQYELIRWPGTVAILALLLVLCAVLLVGVARHSRCALILFSVCGLVAVTGSWLMSGIYLSMSVAMGDLCAEPAEYLVSQSPSGLPPDILLYYTQCESFRSNPFTQRLRESQTAISSARNSMTTVSKVSLSLFKKAGLQPKLSSIISDLNTSERLLTGLTALVDCKLIHYNYIIGSRGLCDNGLLGLVLMLIASFLAACLLTIMIFIDSHTWIYISRKRNDYAQVEEQQQQYAIAQQQQQQQQQMQNHQTMHRTLPRQQNGPPVISGSHTLQHPNKTKHHEAPQQQMIPQHQQYTTMRQMGMGMGTQTLGRHHHSPNHMRQNSACTDHSHPHPHVQPQQAIYQTQQQMQVPPHTHYKQYNPNVSFTENLPPPPVITSATHAPQTISGNPNYTQQQQIYIQQQQMYAQQQYQTLRRKQAQAQAQAQGQMNQVAQGQQIYQANPNHQLNSQQQQQQQQQQLPPPPQVTQVPIAQQQIQQHQVAAVQIPHTQNQQYVTTGYTPAPPSATMAVVTANNTIYVQSSQPSAVPHMTSIESSAANPIYERDKQIYKCSTLGRYGKFDHGQRQNLVPAVIPTVPQIPKFNNGQQPHSVATTTVAPSSVASAHHHHQQQQQQHVMMANNNVGSQRPSIQNCPLPDIPSVGTFKGPAPDNDLSSNAINDLPHNRFYTQKRPNTGKPVPLPKISSFESNQPPPPYLNNVNNNNNINANNKTIISNNNNNNNNNLQQHQQQQSSSDTNSNIKNSNMVVTNGSQHHQMNNNQQLPPPPPPSDDYAVTEL